MSLSDIGEVYSDMNLTDRIGYEPITNQRIYRNYVDTARDADITAQIRANEAYRDYSSKMAEQEALSTQEKNYNHNTQTRMAGLKLIGTNFIEALEKADRDRYDLNKKRERAEAERVFRENEAKRRASEREERIKDTERLIEELYNR